ncbi:Nicotinamidase-related amidase [Tindallia magadiensis]|uniref:Nicotinamidase-related amidase n=1 Tax=Tindallia magadiensis TaxID=69895 RepID=A0A1I3DZJ7_9FIRM|nr:hydrolase [Tindallia magadiensis]SFH92136.1 Nicotinamidase-related amidase [Tindallia magadiensis]
MRLIKENSTAVIIDMQEKLTPHVQQHKDLIERMKILIKGLRALGVPILVTEQYRKGLGPTIPEIQEVMEKEVTVEKMAFSCCDDDEFQKALEQTGRTQVIVAGIEAHVCVLQTVIDLIEKGYQPIVVEDCLSSRKTMDKDIAMKRMVQEGARIVSCESILFELCRYAGTDTFKKISKLVK